MKGSLKGFAPTFRSVLVQALLDSWGRGGMKCYPWKSSSVFEVVCLERPFLASRLCHIALFLNPPANIMAVWCQDSNFGYDIEDLGAVLRVKCVNICLLYSIKSIGQLVLVNDCSVLSRAYKSRRFATHSLRGLRKLSFRTYCDNNSSLNIFSCALV